MGPLHRRPQRLMAFQAAPAAAPQQPEAVIEPAGQLVGVMERTRAAASSMARGIPSRRPQIPAMTARSASVGEKAASAAAARSQNSSTPSTAASNDGTAHTRSAATPTGSRLVASNATVGHDAVTRPASSAAASSTCSQLSRISSRRRPRRASTTLSSIDRPSWRRTARVVATAWATASGSATGASSHNHTPSGNSPAAARAASVARRVLPTPPTPVNVTIGRAANSATRRANSSPWPTKLVTDATRFPTRDRPVRSGGNDDTQPRRRHLEQPLRPRQANQVVLTQRQQTHVVGKPVADQFLGDEGQQHLTAVPGRHHPGRPVDRRTEVVAVPLLRRPGVQPHPHPQRHRPRLRPEPPLRLDRRPHRLGPASRTRPRTRHRPWRTHSRRAPRSPTARSGRAPPTPTASPPRPPPTAASNPPRR